MSRQIPATMTFDDMEGEVIYTTAAVQADPDAADFAADTADWLPRIDAVRQSDRDARMKAALADAQRTVANGRLDMACVAFSDDLYRAVGKDRTSHAWTRFFDRAANRFVRQPLGEQVRKVRGWLATSGDATLDAHRARLEPAVQAADAALVQRGALGALRGDVWQQREDLAEYLTRSRDGLHDKLAQRARERRLPRTWPDLFFRTSSHAGPSHDPSDEGAGGPPA